MGMDWKSGRCETTREVREGFGGFEVMGETDGATKGGICAWEVDIEVKLALFWSGLLVRWDSGSWEREECKLNDWDRAVSALK